MGQLVEQVPAVTPGTHFVISGVPTRYGASYVFMYSVENMLRLVYGTQEISATALTREFNGWELNADGLFRGEERVAAGKQLVFINVDRALLTHQLDQTGISRAK